MTGVIVLAAGESRRMGKPKQLLAYRGTSLLRHAAETALATELGPVVIVLGAEAARCREALGQMNVRTIINPDWRQGMGSSIRAGVIELERLSPDLEGVLILLHDQPALSAARLRGLVEARREGELVVAAHYGEVVGVPAYFHRDLFAELRQLAGPGGAKQVLEKHAGQLRRHELPEARFDIDTPEDYARACAERAKAGPFPA